MHYQAEGTAIAMVRNPQQCLLAPQCLWDRTLTFQKASKHMENHTLRLLIRVLRLRRSHSVFLSVFLFVRPKDCNGFVRSPRDYSSTCKRTLMSTGSSMLRQALKNPEKILPKQFWVSVCCVFKIPHTGEVQFKLASCYFTNHSVFSQP